MTSLEEDPCLPLSSSAPYRKPTRLCVFIAAVVILIPYFLFFSPTIRHQELHQGVANGIGLTHLAPQSWLTSDVHMIPTTAQYSADHIVGNRPQASLADVVNGKSHPSLHDDPPHIGSHGPSPVLWANAIACSLAIVFLWQLIREHYFAGHTSVATWAMGTIGQFEPEEKPNSEMDDLTKAENQAFVTDAQGQIKSAQSVQLIERLESRAFRKSFATYTATFGTCTAIGYGLYPMLISAIEGLDPAIVNLDLSEIGQPMAVVITTIAVTFGDLLSTTLGFGFDRLQAIRQSYYQEAAQLGILTNDLLLIFHDLPADREAAIRRLYRHARAIYFTTEQARNDPRNNLQYIYIPGATMPFDDPLVRLIRQMSTFAGNLRYRDAFLERILDRIDSSCRELSARRDERISWELSRPPRALYFSLLSLNTVFFLAYIMLTINLTWPGYRVFFAAICGACSLLYFVLLDLSDVHRGAFTVNSGLQGETGTAPILRPAIECISFFLEEAKEECRKKEIPLKGEREF